MELEELLPIVTWLTDKYTSKESSSVSYEQAKELMEAVIYCMNEHIGDETEFVLSGGAKLSARLMYDKGYDRVIEKVYEAKRIYDEMINGFTDYQCRNYKDTILNGMPDFFMKYDPRFQPQESILTLDYPLLMGNPKLQGIDLILEYLKGIQMEKELLDSFSPNKVTHILNKVMPGYTSLYMDNICYPVLLNVVGCAIVERPVEELLLSEEDKKEIQVYFQGDTIEKMEYKIKQLLTLIMKGNMERIDYFGKVSKEYAIRIYYALSETGDIHYCFV